jgi:hypothetical protein
MVVVTPKHRPAAAPAQPDGPPKPDPGRSEAGGEWAGVRTREMGVHRR